jgi:hypothetical protein
MIIITQSYSDLLRPKVSRTCIRTWKYSKIHVPLNLDVHLFFYYKGKGQDRHIPDLSLLIITQSQI